VASYFRQEQFIPIGPIWSAGRLGNEFATAGNCHPGTGKLIGNAARRTYQLDKAVAGPVRAEGP
jgi:hypothetical protein